VTGLLRAIASALRLVLDRQGECARRQAEDRAAIEARLDALAAAVEHIRAVLEADSVPAYVGEPTFTPGGED
jgi:hypothetical protein